MAATMKKTARKTAAKAKVIAEDAVKAAEKAQKDFTASTREAIETRVEAFTTQAKDAWESMKDRVKTAREKSGEAMGAVRTSFEHAGAGVRDVNLKVIDLMAADASHYFKTIKKVAAATTMKEALEIQGEYVRTQFETSIKNMREVREIAAEAAKDAFKPIRGEFSKAA